MAKKKKNRENREKPAVKEQEGYSLKDLSLIHISEPTRPY